MNELELLKEKTRLLMRFNPNHDNKGRFSSNGSGGSGSSSGSGGGSGSSNGSGGHGSAVTFFELSKNTFVADLGNGVTATVGLVGDSGKWNASIRENGRTRFQKTFDSKERAMDFVRANEG